MAPNGELSVVTGALGYSGKHIARALLTAGQRVRTLTGHPERANPFAGRIEIAPLCFDDPHSLRAGLEGATVLYNTYWVRFARGSVGHERAVQQSRALFDAAKAAGVERIVHLSISNPSEDSSLPYFRGKAELERLLATSGLSYAVLRPTVLFGGGDVLLNNIAWLLRRLPLFGVAGDGRYRVQPVHVDDLARLAVEHGAHRDNVVIDAVGPERFEFIELVRLIGQAVGSRTPIVRVPRWMVVWAARVLGAMLRDVLLTPDEVDGLMADLLVSDHPATGEIRLSAWLEANADRLGRQYASELQRHYRPVRSERAPVASVDHPDTAAKRSKIQACP